MPETSAAQARGTVHVLDEAGRPVPYAVVSIGRGNLRVADDSGRVAMPAGAADSVTLSVRRIGYREFYGWVARGPDARYEVSLSTLPNVVEAVEITARASTPLSRTGFYDRVDRVQRGAIVGEFITPEELDERNQSLVSNLLQGRRSIRIQVVRTRTSMRGRPIVTGRAGCAMNIVVDGRFTTGLYGRQAGAGVSSIDPNATRQPGRTGDADPDIDELLDGRAIMAVEIYPSSANAPAELIPPSGRGACGIVAIWTGPRH